MTTRPYHLKTFYRTPLTYPENFKISILVVTCGFIGCGCLSHCFSLLGQLYSIQDTASEKIRISKII